MRSLRLFTVLGLSLLLFASCNRDGVITDGDGPKPVIELDSETGIYSVKTGRELVIAPEYKHAEGATFLWTIDDAPVATGASFNKTWTESGDVFITLKVTTSFGNASEELKVEVMDLAPPVISLAVPEQGLTVMQDRDAVLAPDFKNSDLEGFEVKWLLNGKTVGTEKAYTFNEKETGKYTLTIEASNIDGPAKKDVVINVVEAMPFKAEFPTLSYYQTSPARNILVGQTAYLAPRTEYFTKPGYAWSVDGETTDDQTGAVFKFRPEKAGSYTVRVDVWETDKMENSQTGSFIQPLIGASAEITVNCIGKTEEDIRRPATGASLKTQNRICEYTPAPGQFIGETKTGGFAGSEKTPQDAIDYATGRFENGMYVSLGGFGGYITVGFDHSIAKTDNEYDFAIQGNAFAGSSEPGIVWIMQDANENGKPDDEWYELKGSENGKDGTLQDYAVTYFRPAGEKMNVLWTDSDGQSGYIDYLKAFHTQDYYYPAWITEDSYTLRGTCLPARNSQDPDTGDWVNAEYDSGYADNFGNDRLSGGSTVDGSAQKNGFKISNAVYPDGTAATLEFIDFIKVQTAVNAKSGRLGELSTEVVSFIDLSVGE